MTKAKRHHLDSVASAGCVVCRKFYDVFTPAEIHHCRLNGGKRDNAPVIPLCTEHHRGTLGIHTLGKKVWRTLYGMETDFL